MSYEVLVSNLRAAAGKYRKVADSVGTDGVELTNLEPDSFGHIELAAWVKAISEQCDNATKALHDGADGLADSLQSSAHSYESTDQGVATTFQDPLQSPFLNPGSPSAPTPAFPYFNGPNQFGTGER